MKLLVLIDNCLLILVLLSCFACGFHIFFAAMAAVLEERSLMPWRNIIKHRHASGHDHVKLKRRTAAKLQGLLVGQVDKSDLFVETCFLK